MKKISSLCVGLLTYLGGAATAHAQDSFGEAPTTQPQQQQQRPQQQQQQQQQQPAQRQQQPMNQPNNGYNNGYGTPPPAQQQRGTTSGERRDYGIQATSQLHSGPMHAPTPASIPGGQLITTQGVMELVQGGQSPYVLLDILGGPEIIPGATFAIPAHQAGNFNDGVQQQLSGFLQQMTYGNKQTPLIFYCQSDHCWMSYNAALRAINLGYTNVLWYRGGIEAWKAAGGQTQRMQ